MLALQTAYGLTFFPDFRFTFVTHLSNFFAFRPFLMPLGMNIETATYLIKIIGFKNNFFIQIEGSNIYRVTNVLLHT